MFSDKIKVPSRLSLLTMKKLLRHHFLLGLKSPFSSDVISPVSPVIHLPADDFFKKLSHFNLVASALIKGLPGVKKHFP